MSTWLSLPLTLVPASSNTYPLQGILIQGAQAHLWLTALLELNIQEKEVLCYAIPDRQPNQIWGCLVVLSAPVKANNVMPYLALQCAHNSLFLPEKSQLSPALNEEGLTDLLYGKHHLLHPTLGLVELFEPLDWAKLLDTPPSHQLTSQAPEESLSIPTTVKIFTVEAAPVEESLDFLDAVVPERKSLEEKPLSAVEVLRLRKLRAWKEASLNQKDEPATKSIWARLQDKINATPPWTNELEQELEALERRYQNPMNRLFDLLKDDPEKALRYAIPLNNDQIGRGYGKESGNDNWDWIPRWANTSLFQSNSNSGYNSGSSYGVPNNQYYELQRQYQAAAEKLIQEGKFEKAAFIYLRLLRLPKTAAETLIKGKRYEQAASIYLKYLKDEANAAACYEKATRLEKALALYKKLENNRKVGDLYQLLGKVELARVYYEKVLEKLLEGKNYYTAANFCEEKLMEEERAYELAFTGWFHGSQPVKCIQYCLGRLPDPTTQRSFLENLYQEGFTAGRLLEFLQLLRNYYDQKKEQRIWIRALAYLVITEHSGQNINLLRQLLYFNEKDSHLSKDVLRYRLSKRS
ncbi:MAG: hypothetical protein ACRBFS_23830 [Aureispira sp.]